MLDYIIVGGGLGGIALAEELRLRSKSFVVCNDGRTNSSRIAGGIYNPVILKRFKAVADAAVHLKAMNEFYDRVEALLGSQFRFPGQVLRKFHSIEEQNNWFAASDNAALSEFIVPTLSKINYSAIESPFGYGEVAHTGWVDTKCLLECYHEYLEGQGLIQSGAFNHSELIFDDAIKYREFSSKHVIFAEGYGIRSNPWFGYLPLDGTKGEILTISSPDLKVDAIVNSGIFILPLGNSIYKVGATYNWDQKDQIPTQAARQELIEKLDATINCEYQIVDHQAGVRPTVKDRKPLLGTLPTINNVHILNGLGTRGVMLAPAMARLLIDSIELGTQIPRELNISRYDSLRPSDRNE